MNYRNIIKSHLNTKKNQFGKLFSYKDMAKHCRVQTTYLSSVLSEKAHFNDDQVFLACEYLQLEPIEQEYIENIHRLNRSVCQKRIQILKKKIKSISNNKKKSESHIEAKISNKDIEEYYFNPNILLVHMYLTIDEYRTNPKKIMQALELPKEGFKEICNLLEQLKIIKISNNKYHVLIEELHLPLKSKVFSLHHKLMRFKSLEQQSKIKNDQSYSLSVTFSSEPKVKEIIHSEFLNFLKKIQSYVRDGNETEVYQLNFDLFPWKS